MSKKSDTATIEVNKKALMNYLVTHCRHHDFNSFEGSICYRKINKEICQLSVYGRELHCPHDCPRLSITPSHYACDEGRCPKIRATIKRLKEPPSEF